MFSDKKETSSFRYKYNTVIPKLLLGCGLFLFYMVGNYSLYLLHDIMTIFILTSILYIYIYILISWGMVGTWDSDGTYDYDFTCWLQIELIETQNIQINNKLLLETAQLAFDKINLDAEDISIEDLKSKLRNTLFDIMGEGEYIKWLDTL